MTETADLLVIGGGLHGLSAALQTARRGAKVVLVERDFIGRHASGATAAGVRTLGRNPAELPLSLEAAQTWHRMEDLVGDDCGFRACGQLQIAESSAAMARIATRIEALEHQGLRHEMVLDEVGLREIIPDLPSQCIGAAWSPRDGAADPHRALRAFRTAAGSAGVRIHERCDLVGLSRAGEVWRADTSLGRFEAPLVLNAAGAWAERIAALAGDRLEHAIRTSMMIVTERARPRVGPVVGVVGRKLSFKQTSEGTLVIGGGAQGRLAADRNSSTVKARALVEAVEAAVDIFPWAKSLRIVRTWAGMEAMTKDHLPVLGYSDQVEGLIHAFGFSGHGFQLVPSVGRAMSLLATGSRPDVDLAPFSPARASVRDGNWSARAA